MKLWLSVLAFLIGPSLVMAQTPEGSRTEGYVLAAPLIQPVWGGRATSVGGGVEVFLYRGASIGAEIGPIFSGSYVFGLGSANLAYHFLRNTDPNRINPFLTAGYATTFRAGMQNGSTAGGGVNVRLKEHVALRIELRAYMGRLRIHDVSPRFGLTFR